MDGANRKPPKHLILESDAYRVRVPTERYTKLSGFLKSSVARGIGADSDDDESAAGDDDKELMKGGNDDGEDRAGDDDDDDDELEMGGEELEKGDSNGDEKSDNEDVMKIQLSTRIEGHVLQKVIRFCKLHRDDPYKEIDPDGPLKIRYMHNWAVCSQQRYQDFLVENENYLLELYVAAEYLQIIPLLRFVGVGMIWTKMKERTASREMSPASGEEKTAAVERTNMEERTASKKMPPASGEEKTAAGERNGASKKRPAASGRKTAGEKKAAAKARGTGGKRARG